MNSDEVIAFAYNFNNSFIKLKLISYVKEGFTR